VEGLQKTNQISLMRLVYASLSTRCNRWPKFTLGPSIFARDFRSLQGGTWPSPVRQAQGGWGTHRAAAGKFSSSSHIDLEWKRFTVIIRLKKAIIKTVSINNFCQSRGRRCLGVAPGSGESGSRMGCHGRMRAQARAFRGAETAAPSFPRQGGRPSGVRPVNVQSAPDLHNQFPEFALWLG
jgi:hypothetical protein